MKKSEFLQLLTAARAEWEAALQEVGEARMLEKVDEIWTVKDLIVHTSWYVREMVNILSTKVFRGSELWGLSHDERNAKIFQENRQRALAEVLAEDRKFYQQVLELFQALSDEDLNEAACFREMSPDWIPWEVFRGNTYKHYEEHARELRRWLKK